MKVDRRANHFGEVEISLLDLHVFPQAVRTHVRRVDRSFIIGHDS